MSTARPSSSPVLFHQAYQAEIQPILERIDKLRVVLENEPSLAVPSIVVVGDQSAGKSSVLEALSGIPFPRGQSITTRCPLVLCLSSPAPSSAPVTTTRIAVGLQLQTTEADVVTLVGVADRIEQLTRAAAGSSLGVSTTPVFIVVTRPETPALTLIDLPGLTRNPVGNQPADIHDRIRELLKHYITPPATLILAVMSAHVDLPTCECIELAKEVDPLGERTLVVITKADTAADPHLRVKLEKEIAQLGLRLGAVLVRNRSKDEASLTWEASRLVETKFFASHDEFKHLVRGAEGGGGEASSPSYPLLRAGTTALASMLIDLQLKRIRATLPGFQLKLETMIKDQTTFFNRLPPGVSTVVEARMSMAQLLNTFYSSLSRVAQGDSTGEEEFHILPRFSKEAMTYQRQLYELTPEFMGREYAEKVARVMRIHFGITLRPFMSSHVFESLMADEMKKLPTPTAQFWDTTRQYLRKVVSHFLGQACRAHTNVRAPLESAILAWMDIQEQKAKTYLTCILQAESQPFTLNDFYIHVVNEMKAALRAAVPTPDGILTVTIADALWHVKTRTMTLTASTPEVDVESVLDMQIHCLAFLAVTHKRLVDVVRNQLYHHLLRPLSEMHNQDEKEVSLFTHLQAIVQGWKDEDLVASLQEDPRSAQERKKLTVSLARLKKAQEIVRRLAGVPVIRSSEQAM